MIEMTQQTHIRVNIGPKYNKMMIEYPAQIESYNYTTVEF
jgi:hypothetical protein